MNNAKAEVILYQLTTHPLEKVLPRILEKVYDGGLRALRCHRLHRAYANVKLLPMDLFLWGVFAPWSGWE